MMRPIRQGWTRAAESAGSLVVGLFWVIFGLAWLVGVSWYGAPWYLGVPAVPMLVMGLFVVIWRAWELLVRPSLVGQYFGRALGELQPERARPGDTLTVRYERPVRASVEVGRIAVQLVRRETVRRYQHDGSVTDVDDRVIEEHQRPGRRFAAGEVIAEELRLRVPPDAEPAFKTKDHSLGWLVKVSIDTPEAPRVEDELAFTVMPARLAEIDRVGAL